MFGNWRRSLGFLKNLCFAMFRWNTCPDDWASWVGDRRLIVTQFVCQDIFLFFTFLSFFTKQIFLLTTIFLCKKWVKFVDNVDNFVNNSIFPHIFLPQNVDNYSHLSLIFDISTNINSFVCAICTIFPLSIIFFENKLSFLSTNCLTIYHFYPH